MVTKKQITDEIYFELINEVNAALKESGKMEIDYFDVIWREKN